MKRLYFLTMLSMSICSTLFAEQTIYIATNGSNSYGDGAKDNPYLSLEYAIKQHAYNSSKSDTLFINVAEGDYYLSSPIVINSVPKRPIVVKGESGSAKPNFIGGLKIDDWQLYRDGIYRAYIPEVKEFGFSFEQLYVGDKRATLARTPNEGFGYVKSSTEVEHVKGKVRPLFATQRFEFNDEELESLRNVNDEEIKNIRLRFYHKWDITQKEITYLDRDSSHVYMCGIGMKPWNMVTSGSRYIMLNYLNALDIEGEWYLDREEGYVYYMPREGEDMSNINAIAPTIDSWLELNGKHGEPISNITFNNLSFKYSSYQMPKGGNEPMQAAARVRAAIELNYANNIKFIDCSMEHTGGYAIWFNKECHYNTIDCCYIADLGAGGIKIGEYDLKAMNGRAASSHNIVNNSIIRGAGHVLPCGVGVGIFHSSDNIVSHNTICDLRYSGISVGWTWGYNDQTRTSPAVNNLITDNYIHHIGWGELSDMGAVYTLGESHGTRIENNVIHDILSYDYGGWGLYTDEGSTGVVIRNNLAYRCKSGGFHQHYGKENLIENNIFGFCHYFQAKCTRVEEHKSFTFKRNIIIQDRGATLAGPWRELIADVDSNIYWQTKGEATMFDDCDFKTWKEQKEHNSLEIDPMFVDPESDDYRFKSLRSAKKINFIPFSTDKVGVYGSKEWVDRSKLSKSKIAKFQRISDIRFKE